MSPGRSLLALLAVALAGCGRLSVDEQNTIARQDIAVLLGGTGANPDSVRYVSELWRGKLLVVVPGDSGALAQLSARIGLHPAPVPEATHLTTEFPENCHPEPGDFMARDSLAALIDVRDGRKIRDVFAMDPAGRGVLCLVVFYDREDYSTVSGPRL